jgi:hypothetical protein
MGFRESSWRPATNLHDTCAVRALSPGRVRAGVTVRVVITDRRPAPMALLVTRIAMPRPGALWPPLAGSVAAHTGNCQEATVSRSRWGAIALVRAGSAAAGS